MGSKMRISICIPTYECGGKGVEYLQYQFDKFNLQFFKDFDVVISDHSRDSEIKKLCAEYPCDFKIKYIRNIFGVGNSSANINNAIANADGEIIKIMFQDDFLYSHSSLGHIDRAFSSEDVQWVASACMHTKDCKEFYNLYIPHYNDNVYLGNNTMGCPSNIAFRNHFRGNVLFDTRLIWLMDADFYRRMFDRYGHPYVIKDIVSVSRICDTQVTNFVTEEIKSREDKIVRCKYEKI